MATIPIQGNEILVDSPDSKASTLPRTPTSELTSWIMGRVQQWEDYRNLGYSKDWKQYWRMWRGKWHSEDRNRQSERSRLIAPALAQAIEASTAEIEEAVFSQAVWFDIVDDIADEEKLDALMARDMLREDLETANVKGAVIEAILNAAIFGTGIIKLDVQVIKADKPVRNPKTLKLEAKGQDTVRVTPISIRPDDFIPDPAGKNIKDMLGCAERVEVPMHSVLEDINSGKYLKSALLELGPSRKSRKGAEADHGTAIEPTIDPTNSEKCVITEYHGKVPLKMLNGLTEVTSLLDDVLKLDLSRNPDDGDGPLVEAIVTIGNGSTLLRAKINPFTMSDRSIIAFQWEVVPGRFWGRGVAEKGINPQKALDAELRARQDALGFISSPMLGVDTGRVPKGFRMEIKPGKVWLTQGPPDEVIRPVQIGQVNQNTFNQTQEMERMVQMGTGAFDTAQALNQQSSQSGANAASSNSAMMGAFVKRSKRTINNISGQLIKPMIEKSMWRFMQFDPRRYPQDFTFNVKATMGIVAREVEAMQLTQLVGMMPEEYQSVSLKLVEGIINHSSVVNKAEILKGIQEANAPPSEEEQARAKEMADLEVEAQKQQLRSVTLENNKLEAETAKLRAEEQVENRKADTTDRKVDIEVGKLQLQGQEIQQFGHQNAIAEKRLVLQEKQVDANIKKANKS